MADPLDAYNREQNRRGLPLTRGEEIMGGIGSALESIQDVLPPSGMNPFTYYPMKMAESMFDYAQSPSSVLEGLRSGEISESEIPLGVDLVDIFGETDPTLGAPDFLPDDYAPGEIFSYDPAGKGLTKGMPETRVEREAREAKEGLDAEIQAALDAQFDAVGAQKAKDAKRAEDFRAAEQGIAIAQGMRAPDEKSADPQATAQGAFMAAMKDYLGEMDAKSTPKESEEEAIARYKKEFEKATGIDASGKIDKSRALMAFGLNLMQNKAGGKGFSGALAALGDAGKAAMPYIDKAREEARAAQLAAGKYALNQVAAGKSAAAALAKENRAAKRAFDLKMLELEIEAEKDAREDSKIRNIGKNKIIDGVEINYGTSNQETKLAKPSADAALVSNAWNKYSKGQENINKMLGIVEDLSQENAPAFKTIGDRIKKQLGNYGLRDPKIDFGPEGASDEDKFNAMRLSVINEMKRLIIQESQVSDYDRQMLNASFGDINLTTTPQQAEYALNEMLTYFNGKKQNLVPVLQQMYDPSFYLTDNEYNKTTGYLADALEVPFVPPQARNRDGSTTSSAVATVDLTGSQ